MRFIPWALIALLAACDNNGNSVFSEKDLKMKDSYNLNSKLDFECTHEKIPDASADAELVFEYARWLQKNNQLMRDLTTDSEVERLYRVAAEHDHFNALINLQNGAMRGRFHFRTGEHLRFAQRLIDHGIATGYYFLGIFLERGAAGLEKDPVMALKYYRKAADEGSALAQNHVGNKLRPQNMAPGIGLKMLRCAAEQGHADAALALAVNLQFSKKYRESVELYQLAVSAGSPGAAFSLARGFETPDPSMDFYYLGLPADEERVRRYEKISDYLSGYSYASPSAPDINNIVPLPPAVLPEWDGKLQWVEDRIANTPPEKPSEALIHKLAKEKVLDPATGRPLPGSPALSHALFPLMKCLSGDPCPATGYWQRFTNDREDFVQHFEEGDIMPTHEMYWTQSRIWPLADKVTQSSEVVEWGFIG